MDHFDSLIRYFYLTREILEGRTPTLEQRPSLGWWLEQLALSLRGQGEFRKVVTIAQRENVVALRNEMRGHGYMAVDPSAYVAEAESLERVIASIEDEMAPFFNRHRLVILRRTEPRDGMWIATGDQLVGSHLLHPSFETRIPGDPMAVGLTAVNDVFVSDPGFHRFHRISPYIRSAVCPTCHHPRILITDGGTRFIDVFMGHRVELP